MSAKKEKKKKSLLGRILKWTGLVFLLLIIALILIPIFYKDQLKEMALEEANKILKADVGLGDFDLTFISTFPNMTLILDDITVIGREEFEGVHLVDIKQFEVNVGFWSVISGSDIEIKSIALREPKFDVQILQDGTANYDIMKSTEEIQEEYPDEDVESAPFKLSLNHYEITDGYVRYHDDAYSIYAEMVNLNHEGNGDLGAEVIDFKTLTAMDELSYSMDGITYLSHVKTDLDMALLMEFTEESDKYTLKENELKLNELALSFDGFYEMLSDHDNMDLKLKADQISFKDLLSLVPAFYHTGYESMIAKGSTGINGFVKGRMDDKNMPAFEFGMNVANATINYPDAPASFDKIDILAGAKFPGGDDLDKLTLNVDKFKAAFVGNTVDANLAMRNPMTDPYLKSQIIANVDLSTLGQVMPLEEGEAYNGKLVSDIVLDGRVSALENEDYESFKAAGSLALSEFHYESEDLPDGVDVNDMLFEFSPESLALKNMEGKMGRTDFKMNGNIENYMGYFFYDESLKGAFDYRSEVLDLDAFMPETSEETTAAAEEPTEEVEEAAEEALEPLLIPANIDFELNTFIGDLIYDGMDIKNVTGKVTLRDEEAILNNLSLNMLDGQIGMNGKYSTQNHKQPKVDFSYALKDIDIKQLADNFASIEKMAPVAKHARGKISSNFNMVTDVTPSFEPVYNTLTGSGSLFTEMVKLENFEVLEKLSNTINIDKFKDASFKNMDLYFAFKDGKVHVEPFNVNFGNIKTNIQGTTSFEQEIDYKMRMDVPKSEIPKELLAAAEKAVAAAQNIPGFKMKELPDVIPVNAKLTNTVTDPKIETDFREQLMSLGGDVKDAVKDYVDDKVEEVKDSVKAVVDDKVDEVKEDLQERKQKLLDDAQKQADRIKSEAKRGADRVREEGEKAAQKVIDEAGNNPLKKAAAERAADRIRKEANEKADKMEQEANQRADNIMKQAQEQADRLE